MLNSGALEEHVLNRLGYGQSRWHRRRYRELGLDDYLNEQLSGRLPAIGRTGATVEGKLHRSVLERRQIEAMLVDFWFNHFNVDGSGGPVRRMVGNHQNQAVLPHVLGSFGDMLLATAQSPAMLYYLDNRLNRRPRQTDQGEVGLNENYARELMELHTLGIDGGYDEDDVIDVAKIMTGWSIDRDQSYLFRRFAHVTEAKTVMGVDYPADRYEEEGVELLAQLAGHPSTATFLSTKLCRRLISETPSAAAVSAGAEAYTATNGDLAVVVRALINTPDFRDETSFRAKIKPPHRYLASALLAMGATSVDHYGGMVPLLVDTVADLGEEPYEVGPPTGYPEASPYWVSSSSMLGRFVIAGNIARNAGLRSRLKNETGVDGSSPESTVEAIAARLCPGGLSDDTRNAVLSNVRAVGSPERRIIEAAHLILSSPEFVRF